MCERQDLEIIKDVSGIEGLILVKNWLTKEEEKALADNIDTQPWKGNRDNSRNIQIYGPWHDKQYKVKKGAKVTPYPEFIKPLMNKIKQLHNDHFLEFPLPAKFGEDAHTELFVNEYKPEDTLHFHTDHPRTYGPVIYGVSLLTDCDFSFQLKARTFDTILPRRSIYLMTGNSRYKYKHGIPKPCAERRVSLTFRSVIYSV